MFNIKYIVVWVYFFIILLSLLIKFVFGGLELFNIIIFFVVLIICLVIFLFSLLDFVFGWEDKENIIINLYDI